MTDLTDVLHRATDQLAPEAPDLLLARAVRQGSALRRRRRLTTASAFGGLAAAGIAVAVLAAGPFDGSGAPGVVDPGPTAASDATTSPSPPAARARIAVERNDVGATFARIVPGVITDEHDVPAARVHGAGAFESEFDWNGYRVSLMISQYAGPARARCVEGAGTGNGQSCVRVRGGWSKHDATMGDQSYNRWVSVYRDNGFQMWVLIYSSGSEKGSGSGGPPPLDVPDLERVATSPLWFS
jgi:hypothetical protein